MGRPEECARLIRAGVTPATIASDLGLNVNSVVGYLYRAVGDRLFKESEVVFTIAATVRAELERLMAEQASDDSASILGLAHQHQLAIHDDGL